MYRQYCDFSDKGEDSSMSGNLQSVNGLSTRRTRKRLGASRGKLQPIRYGALSQSSSEAHDDDSEPENKPIPRQPDIDKFNTSSETASSCRSLTNNSWMTESLESNTSNDGCGGHLEIPLTPTDQIPERKVLCIKNESQQSVRLKDRFPSAVKIAVKTPSANRYESLFGWGSTLKKEVQPTRVQDNTGERNVATQIAATNNLVPISASKQQGEVIRKQDVLRNVERKPEVDFQSDKNIIPKVLNIELGPLLPENTPVAKRNLFQENPEIPQLNVQAYKTPADILKNFNSHLEMNKENLWEEDRMQKSMKQNNAGSVVKVAQSTEKRFPLNTLSGSAVKTVEPPYLKEQIEATPVKQYLPTPLKNCDPVPVKKIEFATPASGNRVPQVVETPAISNDRLQMPPPPQYKSNQILIVNGREYDVLTILGRGGSSVVYQVFEPTKHQLLAIKCVDLQDVDESIARGYFNEIELLSRLQFSSSVVKLYDHEYQEKEKKLYVVMEKGDTDLATLLKKYTKTKRPTKAMISYYWTEMLTAVKVIHEQGIIHSDLKPANFLLVSGCLKLIDFGIASSIQTDMTSIIKDTQVGTYNYMSPEAIQDTRQNTQQRGRQYKPTIKIGVKSDVWSLGCILYNLIYGKTPFQHIINVYSKLHAICDPTYEIEFPEFDDPLLLDAMKKCLVRDPKERASVDELLSHPSVTRFGLPSRNESPKETLRSVQEKLNKVLTPNSQKTVALVLQQAHVKPMEDI